MKSGRDSSSGYHLYLLLQATLNIQQLKCISHMQPILFLNCKLLLLNKCGRICFLMITPFLRDQASLAASFCGSKITIKEIKSHRSKSNTAEQVYKHACDWVFYFVHVTCKATVLVCGQLSLVSTADPLRNPPNVVCPKCQKLSRHKEPHKINTKIFHFARSIIIAITANKSFS